MDAQKAKLNVSMSIFFKIITMAMSIVVKMALVDICGNEVNGLNALYISIIGVLSVAELGVGSAITFCMYKPIVEGDNRTVSALFHLFQKLYLIIGAVIFFGGVALTPFLHFFAKDYIELDVNMYVTFLLILISVVTTYLFSAKTSLINAYKNNYITTAITQGGVVFQYILQIVVLYTIRSFVGYLICRILAVSVQWIATEIVTKKKYGVIITAKGELDHATRISVKKNVKAMFMHKVGYVLVNSVDSVIISAFVGVVSLGEYSNYTTILSSMTGIITLVFTSLTSVIGHLCVEDKERAREYFESFYLLNFFIGVFFYLGYYAVIDNLIMVLFSSEFVVSKSISFVITLNGFVQFMRRSTLTFRDATGAFYGDRWKPLFEGIVNIILSILLVNYLGVVGVLAATILTNLTICHIIEPYVLYRNALNRFPNKFYLKNYSFIAIFIVALFSLDSLLQNMSNVFAEMLVNGLTSVIVSALVCTVALLINKNQAAHLVKIMKKG